MNARVILFAVLLLGTTAHAESSAVKPAADRTSLAAFQLKKLDGTQLRSQDLQRKVTVLSFWASWCGPCLHELKVLETQHKKLAPQGMSIVAIATDGPETLSTVRSIVKQKRWAFDVLSDSAGVASGLLNPRGTIPYTMFVDKRGRVAYVHTGFASGDEARYEEVLAALLAEPE